MKKAVTSKRVATIASNVLTSKKEDSKAKSTAGSALAQTAGRKAAPKKRGR